MQIMSKSNRDKRASCDVTPKTSKSSKHKSSFDRRHPSMATTKPTSSTYVLQTAQTYMTSRLTPDIDDVSMLKPDVSFNILDTARN